MAAIRRGPKWLRRRRHGDLSGQPGVHDGAGDDPERVVRPIAGDEQHDARGDGCDGRDDRVGGGRLECDDGAPVTNGQLTAACTPALNNGTPPSRVGQAGSCLASVTGDWGALENRFDLVDMTNGSSTIVRDVAAGATLAWTPAQPGPYGLRAGVRRVRSPGGAGRRQPDRGSPLSRPERVLEAEQQPHQEGDRNRRARTNRGATAGARQVDTALRCTRRAG